MCSDICRALVYAAAVFAVSCSSYRQLSDIRRDMADVDVAVPSYREVEDEPEIVLEPAHEKENGPVLMNAVKDMETGEMVAVDIIDESRVVARFRNVAERSGKVTISFDVSVPASLVGSGWQLRLFPELCILGDTLRLDPVLVTGERYRSMQIRGYERYREFVSSIIRDRSGFVRMKPLEIFLERYYPDIYRMKNDTSIVSAPEAENIFGVTQEEILEHYTRYGLVRRNRRREDRSERMLERLTGGLNGRIRLDTVLLSGNGACYRYTQTLGVMPGLKKISVTLAGGIYEDGRLIYEIPGKNGVEFYVSSLSSLADTTVHYREVTVGRNVHDYTNAILDFEQASPSLDTLSAANARELSRIRESMRKMMGMKDFETDSVVITASCSLEGEYSVNAILSELRAKSVAGLLGNPSALKVSSVPENWELFLKIISNDPNVSADSRSLIQSLPYEASPDSSETVLQQLPEYRYFREKIYPRLRVVRLDFYLHRKDMDTDTVCTSEVDTVYMNGVEALKKHDYRKAVEILGGYCDYNSALAYLSAGYDIKALEILRSQKNVSTKAMYLEALALSRLGMEKDASEVYRQCVMKDPAMLHRGRLDPEIQKFTTLYD